MRIIEKRGILHRFRVRALPHGRASDTRWFTLRFNHRLLSGSLSGCARAYHLMSDGDALKAGSAFGVLPGNIQNVRIRRTFDALQP